eukprot:jgi/Hompol1/478/HPOL_005321-RA
MVSTPAPYPASKRNTKVKRAQVPAACIHYSCVDAPRKERRRSFVNVQTPVLPTARITQAAQRATIDGSPHSTFVALPDSSQPSTQHDGQESGNTSSDTDINNTDSANLQPLSLQYFEMAQSSIFHVDSFDEAHYES